MSRFIARTCMWSFWRYKTISIGAMPLRSPIFQFPWLPFVWHWVKCFWNHKTGSILGAPTRKLKNTLSICGTALEKYEKYPLPKARNTNKKGFGKCWVFYCGNFWERNKVGIWISMLGPKSQRPNHNQVQILLLNLPCFAKRNFNNPNSMIAPNMFNDFNTVAFQKMFWFKSGSDQNAQIPSSGFWTKGKGALRKKTLTTTAQEHNQNNMTTHKPNRNDSQKRQQDNFN